MKNKEIHIKKSIFIHFSDRFIIITWNLILALGIVCKLSDSMSGPFQPPAGLCNNRRSKFLKYYLIKIDINIFIWIYYVLYYCIKILWNSKLPRDQLNLLAKDTKYVNDSQKFRGTVTQKDYQSNLIFYRMGDRTQPC